MIRISTAFLVCIVLTGLTKVKGQIDPQRIDIVRDQWGVPHIFAPTDPEVAYGLAWANAEDDFQTMQMTILAAKSMAGRAFGPSGAAADYFVQLINARDLVKREIKLLPFDYLNMLSGYVEGINSYAEAYPDEVLVKNSFPITLEEMLVAYVLSLSDIAGATQVVSNLVNDLEQNINGAWIDPNKGSNAFAVQNKLTEGDFTFLAINSHQPLEGPASWYEAHLVSDTGWNILGGTFPGGATIFHGVNEHLGWAHTVNFPDKVDVYKLQMVTGPYLEYYLDGEIKTLEERKIKLKVKVLGFLKIGVKKKAYWSEFGPVIKNKNGYFAVRYGSMLNLKAPLQWYRMNKAKNWDEFRDALEICGLPGFNIVYADKEDNIFFTSMALLPKRNPDFNWKGIVPGFTSHVLWEDFYGLDALPSVFNPSSGYVFNTNNSVFNASGEGDNIIPSSIIETMGFPTRDNNRSIQFQNLIQKQQSFSYEDLKKIKYDLQLPDSLHYLYDFNPLFNKNPEDYPEINEYLVELQQWDRVADSTSVGATLFKSVYDLISRNPKLRNSEMPLIEAVKQSQKQLIKEYGSIMVPLGKYQRHIRGNKSLPVSGIPDVIASMSTQRLKDGTEESFQGESYIMLVRFTADGPIIETVNAYGASARPGSPHFDDQMELFTKQKLKSMTLSETDIYDHASSKYHPIKN